MKTLNDLDEGTQERILKAFQICVEHMDVFGEVEMHNLCSLFADGVFEDEREARKRKYAPEMYELLSELKEYSEEYDLYSDLKDEVFELLRKIDGGEASNE